VGLAGLTLGGGQGWFTSKYGLTCDNLACAEVTTASGDLVRAAEDENADLLWGLRGGGGNFGVVVSLEYRLHALSEVTAGTIAYPLNLARDVIRHWRDRIVEAPAELGSMAIYVQAPEPMLLVGVCYAGSETAAEQVLRPFVEYASPAQVAVGAMSIVDLGTMFDQASLPGAGN
jgi:FAD/FMN-containing dehydrogenase